ncbi:MAG: hypothetical protein AAF684_07275 [Pseudomonadota bacterium]
MLVLRFLRFSFAAAAFVLPAAAAAQNAGAPPDWIGKLDAYMAQDQYKQQVAYFTREFERARRGRCESVQVLNIGRLLLGPVQFDASGEPVQGTWRTQILVDRCGEQVVHNVMHEASNGRIVPSGMFPGATRTPLAMQDGVAIKMRSFLLERAPADDCRLFVIMDTQLGLPVSGTNAPDKWTERWTIQQCERRDDVLVKRRQSAPPTSTVR